MLLKTAEKKRNMSKIPGKTDDVVIFAVSRLLNVMPKSLCSLEATLERQRIQHNGDIHKTPLP